MRGTCHIAVPAVLAGLLICVAAPAPARAAESGVNIALNQRIDGPANAQELGVGWVRIFVGWSLGEPARGSYERTYLSRLRADVQAYRARGIRTVFAVQDTPGWAAGPRGAGPAPPRSADDYGRFVGGLARSVPEVGAIEIWNEPDSETFWRGAPDPAGYAALLRAAYARIKAQSQTITVVTGGMVGNNHEFLSALYANGAGGSFDAVGVHTDTACLLTSPAEFYREPGGRVGRYSFTGYREVHAVMAANGDAGKGIWMTEIGWNTGSRKPRSCRDGAVAGTRAEGVDQATQARFLTLAYRCIAADPYVHVALWFSLQDVGRGAGYGDHLGLVRQDGRRKRAFAAMRAVRNGRVKAARCGGVSDRTGPSLDVRAPTEGAVLTDNENLPVRVRARDNRGGTGMRRVELYVNGRHVRTWGGGAIASSWFGFRKIGYGTHRVAIRASDKAQNRSERTFTVTKVDPRSLGDAARPLVRWRSKPRRAGRRVRFTVDVTDRGPAGVRKVTLYVNGNRVRTRKRGGLWRARVPMRGAAARPRVTVRAEDRAGNVTRSKRYIRR